MLLVVCSMNMTCEEDDDLLEVVMCDQSVVIDSDLYVNLNSDTFSHAEIVDDCLQIEITSSGCSGESWEFKLVDSGVVAESLPEQRNLKFKLVNEELCLAIFSREVSFDLTPLQVDGSNEVVLNIEGFNTSLSYKY